MGIQRKHRPKKLRKTIRMKSGSAKFPTRRSHKAARRVLVFTLTDAAPPRKHGRPTSCRKAVNQQELDFFPIPD